MEGYRQAWIANDPDKVEALFTQDAVYAHEAFQPGWNGRDESSGVDGRHLTGRRDGRGGLGGRRRPGARPLGRDHAQPRRPCRVQYDGVLVLGSTATGAESSANLLPSRDALNAPRPAAVSITFRTRRRGHDRRAGGSVRTSTMPQSPSNAIHVDREPHADRVHGAAASEHQRGHRLSSARPRRPRVRSTCVSGSPASSPRPRRVASADRSPSRRRISPRRRRRGRPARRVAVGEEPFEVVREPDGIDDLRLGAEPLDREPTGPGDRLLVREDGDRLERRRHLDQERALPLVHAPAFPREGDLAGPDARTQRKIVAADLLGELAPRRVLVPLAVVEAAAGRHPERLAERRLEPQQQHLGFGVRTSRRAAPRDVFHGGPGRI